MGEFVDRLRRTDDVSDVLRLLARGIWRQYHGESVCPPAMIPDHATLARWKFGLDADADPVSGAGRAGDTPGTVTVDSGAAADGAALPADLDIETYALEMIAQLHHKWQHEQWEGVGLATHPLATLVREWQNRATVAVPFLPKPKASLPSLQQITKQDIVTMPGLPGHGGSDSEAEPNPLPGFEPAVTACPSWILWLYDRAGGESMRAGRGAPWDLHLFVSAFLHLDIIQRNGQWTTLRFPHLREHEADWPVPHTPSIERWLFPHGWDKSNRAKYWHRLPEALWRMKRDLGLVPIDSMGSVALIFPSVIPDSRDHPLVEFTIRVPRVAANGARIDWNILRKYRQTSAAQYRAYLSACAFMDRSAHHGMPITARIPAQLNADGSIRRHRNGRIVKGPDQVANPMAQFVKTLFDDDLTRMIGFDANNRSHRHQARAAFERLHADGVIDLRAEHGGWRIFGTATE